MGLHDEAKLDRKFVEFAKLMNIHLNHFPKHEKYGLALEIRRTAYAVYGFIVEAQKRYHKKTALSSLDVEHEKLRMLVRLAFELGYFEFKDGKRSCFNFETRLASNLDNLHRELADGSYQPRPYYSFMVYEPKPRRIFAPAFRDLVVQHAIYAVAGPIFERTFIDQSFACRVGLGTHKAADYAQAALQAVPRDSYTLKLDVRKFFYRIDRPILRGLIERKIKDSRFVDLMMLFADHGEPVGIPIGNLLSQLYALIYLNPLDHFIKRELGVRHYCRYVDDFILFGISRDEAAEYQTQIITFLAGLKLELSKSTIAPVSRGVNFVGYRTWASKRFIRRHSLYTFRSALKRGRMDSAVSALGHARRTHSLQHMLRHLKEHYRAYHHQLPKAYRHLDHPRAAAAGRRESPAPRARDRHSGWDYLCHPA